MRKDWEVKKLGDVCDIQNGFAFKSSLFKEQGLPILRISNIQNDTITLDNIVYFMISDYNINLDRFKVYPGDIVVALSGATTGKIGINRTDLTFYLNQRVALCRETDAIIKGYLFHYLRTKTIELLSMAGGVAQPNLSTNQIQQLTIPVPPLQVQRQIVEELDCLTSIIEKQKKQLEELDNLAQAIFYDMFGDPIDNEKGWPTLSFGNLFLLRSGNSLPAKKQIPGDFKVYGGNGINGTHVEFNREGEFIIIGRVGAYCGNVRIVKGAFWLTDNAFELKQIKEIQDTIYLLFLLRSINLFKYANKAAQPVISNTVLRDIMIPLPPLPLQQQFASKIEAIEKQKELIKKSIKETEDLFNSRMDYYFN